MVVVVVVVVVGIVVLVGVVRSGLGWLCSGVRLVVCTLGFGVGGLELVGHGLCFRVWGMCFRVGRSVLGVDGL